MCVWCVVVHMHVFVDAGVCVCARVHMYVPVCALVVFRDRNKDDVSQILF